MQLIFDQKNGYANFKSDAWEFSSNKLKQNEEYRIEISFRNPKTELQLKLI
jgi:hypothetical protein